MLRRNLFLGFIMILNLLLSANVFAQGDEATFQSVAPDALLVLDLSGSMNWGPAGKAFYARSSTCAANTTYCTGTNCANGYCEVSKSGCSTECPAAFGSSLSCAADTTNCSGAGCQGGYCSAAKSGCSSVCSRLEMAKRAIFSVLDDDRNNVINSQDSASLGIRIGYMRFYSASSEASPGIRRVRDISVLGSLGTGTSYQSLFCGTGEAGSCSVSSLACNTSNMGANPETIVSACATGGTPLRAILKSSKTYLDTHKAADVQANTCRQKFVVLISDGADTYACGGNGAECQGEMYERRRAVVAATKELADAGYKVFVIGLGAGMPTYLVNTLNWMAYYGGTITDPTLPPPASIDYSIPNGCNADPRVLSQCCLDATNNTYASACYPAGITSCMVDPSPQTSMCYDATPANQTNFRATNSDPGYINLTGYAFISENADDLTNALRTALGAIGSTAYSFTQSSIQTVRTIDENYLYEATFTPLMLTRNDSLWPGSLKRYAISGTGEISPTADWNAGAVLRSASAAGRKIYTYKSGAMTEFNTTNITQADLALTGATAEAMRLLTISFIRGGEQSGSYVNWKLGDIFHSSPITVGTPSPFYSDKIDKGTVKGFDTYRSANIRTTANGKRVVVAGANLGQFHVFKAADAGNGGGSELWSFIPPNFMPRLPSLAHSTHPTSCSHQYFVDGPTSAYDVWLPSLPSNGTAKSGSDWKTLLVLSEGRGGVANLWSSSSSCHTGFSGTYSATAPHFCGYYALDVTDTTSTPTLKWILGGSAGLSATHGSHLGQPWSKMNMGRVRDGNNETWVGFIGGGYAATDCAGAGVCDTKGKGFYAVKLTDGSIFWSYTHSGNDTTMAYSMPGQANLIDNDNDGFIDRAYIGDLGGNIWRYKFCQQSNPLCAWTGKKLFDSTAGLIRPVYTKPAATLDKKGNLWIYFATGNVNDPTSPTSVDRFYAVKDVNSTLTYTVSNLRDISSSVYDPQDAERNGWYIQFPVGEKILSDPFIFEGVAYFTTYTPPIPVGNELVNVCDMSGVARLYALDYVTGKGMWSESGTRSKVIGAGVSSVQVSINPVSGEGELFAVTSVGGTQKVDKPVLPDTAAARLLYWRDMRID
jgi:hypothetical protein